MEDLKILFASNLINLRTKSGMTQLELAEKINYSDKSVSKWESGRGYPSIDSLKVIAGFFSVLCQ